MLSVLYRFMDSDYPLVSSNSLAVSGEATHINYIVFGLTRLGLEPTIYRIRGEYTNHYTIDAVIQSLEEIGIL